MTTTITSKRPRTKYRFKSRIDAETAYQEADRARLAAEWFATAMMQDRLVKIGSCPDCSNITTVGYFLTNNCAFVYATTDADRIHCIRGIWDIDGISDLIAALMRYDDSHEFGRLLDKARFAAYKAV